MRYTADSFTERLCQGIQKHNSSDLVPTAARRGYSPPPDLSRYRDDPVAFCREVLGDRLWAKQVEVLEALASGTRVAVRSGHGCGKTWVAARAVLWFLLTRPGAIVVTTAPGWRQVRDLLWRHIREARAKSITQLGGRLTQTEYDLGDRWYAVGLSTDEPERFQGYHAALDEADEKISDDEYWAGLAEFAQVNPGLILLVVDEASGVAERIYEAARGFLTTAGARVLLIGNPTRTEGMFYRAHRPDSGWTTIPINAEDAPPRLVDLEWLAEMRRDYGEDSPVYAVRVRGEFPREGPGALFPLWLVEAAADQTHDRDGNPLQLEGQVEFGIDVADRGMSETVVVVRRGHAVTHIEGWQEEDTRRTSQRIADLMDRYRPAVVKIDLGASGKGVYDNLRNDVDLVRKGACRVMGINFGGMAREAARFGMARDEMFWALSRRFRDRQVTGITHRRMVAQLTGLEYELDAREKIKVISKKTLATRGLESPDYADALALAFYLPRAAAQLVPIPGDMLNPFQAAELAQPIAATSQPAPVAIDGALAMAPETAPAPATAAPAPQDAQQQQQLAANAQWMAREADAWSALDPAMQQHLLAVLQGEGYGGY